MCSSYCRWSSGSYDIAHISSGRGLGRVENLHQALQVAQEEKLQNSEPRNRTCGEALSGEPGKWSSNIRLGSVMKEHECKRG